MGKTNGYLSSWQAAKLAGIIAPFAYQGAKRLLGSGYGKPRLMAPKKKYLLTAAKASSSIKRQYGRSYRLQRLKRRRTTKCQVKKLCKFMKQQQATHIHRQRDTQSLVCDPNKTNLGCKNYGGTIAEVEAALTNLRFFDPSINDLVSLDATAQGYSRDIQIAIYRVCTVTNNGTTPAYMKVYSCTPKVDTSVDPVSYFNNGLVDQGAPYNVSPLINFKDSDELRATWNVKLARKKLLRPGQTMICKSWTKQFDYNFNVVDTHSLAYQKRYGGHCWVARVVGTPGHDPVTTTKISSMDCGVDIIYDTQYTITYDAGKDIKIITLANNSVLPTGPVVTQVTRTNQTHSLA